MTNTDRQGYTLSEYPMEIEGAQLLGINGDGFAEYVRNNRIIAAKLDADGALKFPAPEFGIAHELSLEQFEFDLPTYLVKTAEERGEWRALTDFAEFQLSKAE